MNPIMYRHNFFHDIFHNLLGGKLLLIFTGIYTTLLHIDNLLPHLCEKNYETNYAYRIIAKN